MAMMAVAGRIAAIQSRRPRIVNAAA